MDGCQSPETVVYAQKEYTEIVLNGEHGDAPSQEPVKNKAHTVYVSSLDSDVDQQEERWFETCPEKEIPKTVTCPSLLEKYVAKTVLHVGIRGSRPKPNSVCTFTIESKILLDCEFLETIQSSSLFEENKLNTDMTLEIGSSDTEIERALELALMDMCEGERSEVILSVSRRKDKLVDQCVTPVPCLKCIIKLSKVISGSDTFSGHVLSLLNISKEDRFHAALRAKERGVELFKAKRYCDAFHRFASGVKIVMSLDSFLLEPEDKDSKNSDDTDILSLYSTLCSNMAECQLKENNPSQAISLCRKALVYDPCNVKAMFRQASAAWAIGDVDQADSMLQRLLQIDPNNSAARRLNNIVQTKMRMYEVDYTRMMKRIFHN